MPLNHSAIAELIPHAGEMVLLDRVIGHEANSLHATSASHRRTSNPLRHEDRLPVSAGIEYAAQATAIHGALIADSNRGRDVQWHVDRLDDIGSDMDIRITLLTNQTGSAMYEFQLSANDSMLMSGRLAVFFPEQEPLA
jgi:predicted hotdog family 3-hydroxylacyl-ACP dehydratase